MRDEWLILDHGFSLIIASLTCENLAERLRACRAKRPMLCFHADTDDDGHPLENEDESGGRV